MDMGMDMGRTVHTFWYNRQLTVDKGRYLDIGGSNVFLCNIGLTSSLEMV